MPRAGLYGVTPELLRHNTIYRIASITKQFTAAAILRLVEQGRVDLDADMLRYLPEFHSQGRAITVRQLLNHTSGIQSLTEVPKYVPKERLDLTDAEILDTFQDEPPHFRPGENFLYNNSGFYLLGMIIERVTGQLFADHLKQSMFDPHARTLSLTLHGRAIGDAARQ